MDSIENIAVFRLKAKNKVFKSGDVEGCYLTLAGGVAHFAWETFHQSQGMCGNMLYIK